MHKAFTPYKIKDLEIKNRMVLPPMVAFTFAGEDNFVSEKNIDHYASIAKGGAGLIIVEATCVSKDGRLSEDQLGIWSDDFIPGLRKITEACHQHDAKVFIQLHHAGLRASKKIKEDTVTSWNYDNGKVSARALTKEEIHGIEKDFIDAAIRAEKAGFDGIELHGAHSYLLTQFFSSKVNQKTDEYGGSLENRMRMATEIFKGIKEKVQDDFVIGIRMGSNEHDLQTSIEMAKKFEALGMDYLHISTGFDNTPIETELPEDFPCNWIVYGATKIKGAVNIPVVAVNSIKTAEHIQYLVDGDLVDFVAIGRAQLADYNFVKHLQEGNGIISCLECNPCQWFTNGENCPRHKIIN